MAEQQSVVAPSGVMEEDGSLYYTKEDITSGIGTKSQACKIKLLPVGNIPLLLFPHDASTKTIEYGGDAVPIYASTDDDGHKYYSCKHVIQKADEKKGRKTLRCGTVFIDSNTVNIGSITSHCIKHWRVTSKKFAAPNKSSRLLSFGGFTRVNKKQKTAAAPTATAPSAAPPVEEVDADDTQLVDKCSTAMDASVDDTRAKDPVFSSDANVSTATNSEDTNKTSVSYNPDLAEKADEVDEEIVMESCNGIKYTDVHKVEFNTGYEFVLMYPFNIHAPTIQQSYKESNLLPTIDWSVHTSGHFISNKCPRLFSRNLSKPKDVKATTTHSGNTACVECVQLQFNQKLRNIMITSASNTYGNLPNALCPTSVLNVRYHSHRDERAQLRHTLCNQNRKLTSLSRNIDDYSRLMTMMQEKDVPSIKRLMITHFRNNGSVESFMTKLIRAADYKLVGNMTYRRNFVQRGRKQRDGKPFDEEAYKTLKLTILMWKMGNRRLVETYKFENGGLSYRQARRHMNQYGTVPSFKPGITTCIDNEGKDTVRKNMDDLFRNPKFLAILPKKKCLVHILVDGVAIDECLNIDESILPHQVTGVCRHCLDTNFITYDDATRIEAGLNEGTFHLAKEAEVFVLTFNSGEFTSAVVLCISPTCKKDDIIGESTNTVKEILSTILEHWHSYPQQLRDNYILSTIASDGAPAFRKGVGQVLSKDLSLGVRAVYVTDGTVNCKLLNLTGSPEDITGTVDNDHLLKRLRARVKTKMGITIYTCNFNKVDITHILAITSIVTSQDEAHRLFHPEDLMDVLETVKCMYAIGCLADMEWHDYPAQWRSDLGNRHKYKEIRLLGAVGKMACTAIVGHEDDIAEEGNHLSVSEYLTLLSKFAHVLFFLFRKNKTDFIPAQNYRNWQEMIKNMFISVTKAKLSGVEDFYWFLNTSKKIEEFFGIMRSFAGGNPNFDSLELRNRAGDAATCDWIYGEHPEWKEQSRRLKSCIDRKNVRSWKGDTKVANVNEVACWNNGRDQALAILRSAQLFSENELDINHIMETEPGVDMFRPYCRTIGVLAGDRAEYTLADLDEEADDEEVEA